MIKKVIFFVFVTIAFSSFAQLHEVGFQIGGTNYIGDVGATTYIKPNDIAFGLIYKRNLNSRVTLRGTFTYLNINADDADADNSGRQLRGYSFSNAIKELAGGIEFSWFEFNLASRDKSKTHTPYMLFELALINYKTVESQTGPNTYEYKNKTSVAIPFGLGYKTKIMDGLAVAVEVGVRYTFSDDLDYNNSEIPGLDFGNPKSNDWYVSSGINLTYTFGRPPCYATASF